MVVVAVAAESIEEAEAIRPRKAGQRVRAAGLWRCAARCCSPWQVAFFGCTPTPSSDGCQISTWPSPFSALSTVHAAHHRGAGYLPTSSHALSQVGLVPTWEPRAPIAKPEEDRQGPEVRAAIPTPAAGQRNSGGGAWRAQETVLVSVWKRCCSSCSRSAAARSRVRPLFRLPRFWFSALNSQPTLLTSLARWARVQSVSIQNARFYTQCMFFHSLVRSHASNASRMVARVPPSMLSAAAGGDELGPHGGGSANSS